MSDPIVGIDLGTSNTVVAHADAAGAATVLGDANGFKIHPSVVSFHPSGGVVVGAAAKQRKVIDPKNTIYSVKRLIGRAYGSPEVQTAKQRAPYQIKEGANQLPLVVTRGGEFAIPEISAIVLDHARIVAETSLKQNVSRAVVTVPASFNDAQRSATATAGSIAGLTVVRVLNEPTAAALAYGHTRNLNETIAVYDFGGGTFDITILKLADQVYEVLGTAGDSFLGGDDLDERIVDRMVDQFLAEHRVDLRTNEVSMMRLRAVAEQTKIELSRRSRAVVRVDEIAYGAKGKSLDLQIEIRRDEFVTQVADIIDKTFPVCAEAMKLAGLTTAGIDDVILVGGTTKIPYVRDQVTKFFSKAPRADVSPEDAVALGAALQARALDQMLAKPAPAPAPAPRPASEPTDMSDTEAFEREGERKARRGAHHDIFEMPTPKPAPPSAPPGTPVIGRLTKQVAPTPPSGARTTSPRATAQRPPATPPSVPQQIPIAQHPTLVMEPPAPTAATTTPGMAVARADAHLDLDTDIGFPNIATDKGLIDLDLEMPPSTPAPRITRPSSPPPAPRPSSLQTGPVPLLEMPGWPAEAPPSAPSVNASPHRPAPVVLDVTPRGLGIGTVAGFCEELIRRNSRVPTEMRKMFTTSRDDQDAVRIIVVQGESRRMTNNTVIADLRLDGLPRRPRGETSIEVTFMIDANGILQVRARDAQTGRDTRASLDIIGSLPEEDVSASRERVQQLRR